MDVMYEGKNYSWYLGVFYITDVSTRKGSPVPVTGPSCRLTIKNLPLLKITTFVSPVGISGSYLELVVTFLDSFSVVDLGVGTCVMGGVVTFGVGGVGAWVVVDLGFCQVDWASFFVGGRFDDSFSCVDINVLRRCVGDVLAIVSTYKKCICENWKFVFSHVVKTYN